MQNDPESLVAQAAEVYGDYLEDIQALTDLLNLAKRHPENTHQISLLETAIRIATGIGSFARNLPTADTSSWESRQ